MRAIDSKNYAILSLLLMSVGTYLVLPEMVVNDSNGIQHALEVQREANQTQSALTDCETAYRGYLLTYDETYLEPLASAKIKLPRSFVKLKRLTAESQYQAEDVAGMDKLAQALVQLADTISTNQNADMAGHTYEQVKHGKFLMDSYRTYSSDLTRKAAVDLAKSQILFSVVNGFSFWVRLIGSILWIVIAVWLLRIPINVERLPEVNYEAHTK